MKLSKKKILNDLAQQTLEVYDKADEWFIKTADLDLVSKKKK